MKRARIRAFISAAAFSVNVIARMRSTGTPSSHTARTNRSTSTRVLPLPAPASRNRGPSRRSTARRCSGVRSTASALLAADRWIGAATVPRAGLGAGPHLAAAHARGQVAHAPARGGELLLEFLGVLQVLLHEPLAQLLGVLARDEAARLVLAVGERHVHAADGLEVQQLAHGEHVESHL